MSTAIKDISDSLASGGVLDDVFDDFIKDAGVADDEANRLRVAFQNFNTEGKNAKQINAGVTASLQGLTGGLSKAAVKQALMNTALNTMVSLGIGAALTLIAKGYQYLAEYQEKTIETGREATNAIKESNKAYQENTKWIEQNADRYAELAKGVERGVNLSLTTAEFDEYNKLSQEIANKFPELVVGYDSLGNAILACGDDVTKLNSALNAQKKNNLADTLSKTTDIVKAFKTESNDSTTFLQSLGFGETTIGQESTVVKKLLDASGSEEEFIEAYQNLSILQRNQMAEMYANSGVGNSVKEYYENIDILIDKNNSLKQAQAEAAEGMQELASAYLQNDVVFKTFGEDAQNALLNIADNLSYDFFTAQDMTTAKDFKDWSNEATQAINNSGLEKSLNDIFSVSQSSVTKNSFVDLNEDIQKVANALKIEDLEDFKLKLGFDEEMFDASFEAAKDNLMAELNEEFASDTAITDWLNTLTQAELDIVANFELRGTESLDYLKQKVASTLALTKDLENLSSGVDKALGGYDIITTALSELNSEGRITSETLEELQGILGNVEGAFQYTSQGIQVNAQALKQMADNTAEATLTEIEMREALDVIEYQKKTAELNKYCEAHEGLQEALENNSLSEYNDGIEDVNDQLSEFEISTIEALYTSTTALAENINGYDELEMRIHAAASALNDYVRAQETANASDNMQTAAGGLEGAKNLYDQGWTTKDDYTSYMDYIGYQDKGTDNYVKHAEELFKRAEKYLTEDASGVHKFINDMISKGIEGVEGTDYTDVKFTPKVDLDNVADEMDMTLDFVTDMFLAMRDAGYEVNFSSLTEGIVDGLTSIDSASATARTDLEGFRQQIDKLAEAGVDVTELEAIYTEVANAIQGNPINFDPTLASLDELTAKSEDARQSIDELANNAGVPFEFKADLNGDVGAIKSQLESLQEFKDTQLTVGTEEWKNANILIAQTVGQLHEAEDEVILSIDTTDFSAQATHVVELIRNFKELQNEKEVNLAVNPNFDTSKINGELESIRSELSSLNDEEYSVIKTTLQLDDSSVDSLQASIKNIDTEITGKLTSLEKGEDVGVIDVDANTSQAEAEVNRFTQQVNNTPVTMYIKGDTGQLIVDANAGKSYIEGLDPDINVGANTTALKSDINSVLDDPFSIRVNAIVSGLPGNTSPANGTAHSSGTVWHYPHAFSEGSALWQHYRNASHQAYAGGNWGLHQNEQGALINELGPEIIVRDGRWFTVNNGYPTLTDLKAGDIIFNHKQSEAILSKGYITGSHGKLLGNSHADGTIGGNAFNNYVTGGGTNLVKPSSSSSKSSTKKTSKKNTSKTSDLDDEAEKIDWIERKIKKLERTIEKLGKTASATWKVWTSDNEKIIDRNDALTTSIEKSKKEIDLQKKAAKRYYKEADDVGLKNKYVKKVQDGTIDIQSIKSEKTRNKIEEYQKWYDKYLESLDKVADLEDDIAAKAKEKFENVAAEYEAKLSAKEHEIEMLEGAIDNIEASGHIVTRNYYDQMIAAEEFNKNTLNNELTSLTTALSEAMKDGDIAMYSEDWYDMKSQIQEVEKAIQDADASLIEYNNSLRELDWERFERQQNEITKVRDESDFLIGLMSDDRMYDKDTGAITNEGKATVGLHALNYDVYKAQVKDYAAEINKINSDIAKDPTNTILLDQRDKLIEQQREMVNGMKDEEQAVKDLAEQGYNALLDALNKSIDKRKEALSDMKSLGDYERDIADQTKNIASLEKRLAVSERDTSEAGKLNTQQLRNELDEAKKNLEQTEMEQYLSEQEQMLDKLSSDSEQFFNERLENIELLMSEAQTLANTNASDIKTTLEAETKAVGVQLSTDMSAIWSPQGEFATVVSGVGTTVSTALTTTNNTLEAIKNAVNKISGVDEKGNPTNTATGVTVEPTKPTTSSTQEGTKTNVEGKKEGKKETKTSNSSKWGSWFKKEKYTGKKSKLNKDTSIVDRLKYFDFSSSFSARKEYYKAMGGSGTYKGTASQNTWMIKKMKANGYAKGGTIGNLIKRTGEDGFVLARSGETIITAEAAANLAKALQLAQPMIDYTPNLSNLTPIARNVNTTIDIGDIQMYGVNDPKEFAINLTHALKHNQDVKNIIQADTLGIMTGKNSHTKFKY